MDRLELNTEKINNLGQHSDSISSMNFSKETSKSSLLFYSATTFDNSAIRVDALITGSWDRSLRFWDPRASNAQQSSQELPERIYYMDLVNHTLVVAMASRLFHIYDIRKMDQPAQTRESSLKFMTRALACMADGQGDYRIPGGTRTRLNAVVGYATASVEGRIAVDCRKAGWRKVLDRRRRGSDKACSYRLPRRSHDSRSYVAT